MASYSDGCITSIVFHNFLTYDDARCTPGENLNLFIGVNGAGKSSVICGICLAVGGSPKVLGRSERVSDYIKHGCDSGFVELTLADEKRGPQKVKIVINRPNTSEYFRNDIRITQKGLHEFIAEYNIQIDNPCTFLAQDKVKSFAEQNPVELLKNTEKAANPKLLDEHDELIEHSSNGADLEKRARDSAKRLELIEGDLQTLAPRVANYRRRLMLQTRIKLLEKKMAICRADEFSEKVDAYKELAKRQRNAVEAAEDDLKNCATGSHEQSQEIAEYRTKLKELKEQYRKVRHEVSQLVDPEMFKRLYATQEAEFKEAVKRHKNFERDLATLQSEVEAAKARYVQAVVDAEGYEELAEAYKKSVNELREQEDQANDRERELHAEYDAIRNEFKQLQEVQRGTGAAMKARTDVLRRCANSGADAAWEYYLEHRDLFQYPVYVPMIHVTVNGAGAQHLETLLSYRDIEMFICGSKHDEMLLTAREHRWRINTTVMDMNNRNLLNHSELNAQIPEELKLLGFTHYAIEGFSAPEVIKQYFCNVSFLHVIPIGGAKVEQNYDRVCDMFRHSGYRRFIANRTLVNLNVSRYTGEVIGTNSDVKQSRIFTAHSQEIPDQRANRLRSEELKREGESLQARVIELNQEKKRITLAKSELTENLRSKKAKRVAVHTVETAWRMKAERCRELLNNRPDIESARAALAEANAITSKELAKLAEKSVDLMESMENISTRGQLYEMAEDCVNRRQAESEAEKHRLEKRLNECKLSHEDALNELRRTKTEAERWFKNLKELCGLSTSRKENMNDVEKKIMETMEQLFDQDHIPTDRNDIVRELADEKAKLHVTTGDNGSQEDALRHEELTKEKEELVHRRAQQANSRMVWEDGFRKEIEKWRVEVEKLINGINENYCKFFERMGCLGEVHLEVPENDLEIQRYGIMIMVSFRGSERLRRLDHQVQSGGERSVSTMLYLLALQELCNVPFRCVDEINQGMDPVNERRVFEILVETLSGGGNLSKSQYFLLTPKLLHGLAFSDKVTVQLVHNGPFLEEDAYTTEMNKFMDATERLAGITSQ